MTTLTTAARLPGEVVDALTARLAQAKRRDDVTVLDVRGLTASTDNPFPAHGNTPSAAHIDVVVSFAYTSAARPTERQTVLPFPVRGHYYTADGDWVAPLPREFWTFASAAVAGYAPVA